MTRLKADVGQGLSAVASTDKWWHVLSYDADPTRAVVRIYSARHDELEFRRTRDLATRRCGLQHVYLHGSYQVRFANELVDVGDYVGLAGTASKLAVALVLPESGVRRVLDEKP